MNTETRLRSITTSIFGEVTPETHFINDCGADSLDMVEYVLAVEDEFGIELSDDDAESVMTFADVIRLVTKKLAED